MCSGKVPNRRSERKKGSHDPVFRRLRPRGGTLTDKAPEHITEAHVPPAEWGSAIEDLLHLQQTLLRQAGQAADDVLRHQVFTEHLREVKPNTRERRHDDAARLRAYLDLVLAQVRPGLSLVDETGRPLDLDTERALPIWGAVTAGLVTTFRAWMFRKGYALETINGTLSTVRVFAELAVKARVLPHEELERIRAVKGYRGEQAREDARNRPIPRLGHKKAEETLLTEEQREALFRVPDRKTPQGWRDLLLLLLLYDLGIRPNELVTARLCDLDLRRGLVRVYRHKTDGQEQWLALSRDTWEVANRYLEHRQDRQPEAPLIVTTRKNKQLIERVTRRRQDGTAYETTPGISTRNLSQRVHELGVRGSISMATTPGISGPATWWIWIITPFVCSTRVTGPKSRGCCCAIADAKKCRTGISSSNGGRSSLSKDVPCSETSLRRGRSLSPKDKGKGPGFSSCSSTIRGHGRLRKSQLTSLHSCAILKRKYNTLGTEKPWGCIMRRHGFSVLTLGHSFVSIDE